MANSINVPKHTNKVIDHLINNPNQFGVSINLQMRVRETNGNSLLIKLKYWKIKSVLNNLLFCKFQGTEQQQEYNRFGMDWKIFTQC